MRQKVEADYNASQVNAVTQGLDGNPVTLIQVRPIHCIPGLPLVSPKANSRVLLLTSLSHATAAPFVKECGFSLS